MTYRESLSQRIVAISTSESPDMAAFGLSEEHLRDAMAEIARHLLALGARLAYGGDLRQHGFTELLFELVARHRRDADLGDERTGVINYLAWPVHIGYTVAQVEEYVSDLEGSARLVLLDLGGRPMTLADRCSARDGQPSESEWSEGLTTMRKTMRGETEARIVLGGRVDRFKGVTPGIAEEALLSLQVGQPLFIMGGFGGCARDIVETLGLAAPWAGSRPPWAGRTAFEEFKGAGLNNGLTPDENSTLIHTPHVDQAVTLIIRGLLRLDGDVLASIG